MTPERQRIALAALEGWTFITRGILHRDHGLPPGGQKDRYTSPLPDYLNDRNALSQIAVKLGLTSRSNTELRVKWVNHLRSIVSRRMPKNKAGSPLVSDVDLLMAKNEELAESILRTIGKWVES